MTPDFLAATGGHLSPAELREAVASWQADCALADRWRAEHPDLVAGYERALADQPADRCKTCASDQGDYCSLEADSHHPAWHDNGGVHGGVPCPGWLPRAGEDGEAE